MKTKLLLTSALITILSLGIKAQCTASQTASITISTTTVIPFSDPFTIKICPTGTAYDTTGNTGRIYYLETGGKLTLKMNSTTVIYMKTGSFLTVIGNGSSIVYREAGATVTGTPSANNSCSVVSFPTSPSCGPTGITEKNSFVELISFFPNPAKNNLTVVNDNTTALHATVINALGQKVRSFTIESGKKNIDVSDMPEGLYYLSLSENNKVIAIKKLIISK